LKSEWVARPEPWGYEWISRFIPSELLTTPDDLVVEEFDDTIGQISFLEAPSTHIQWAFLVPVVEGTVLLGRSEIHFCCLSVGGNEF
jgi:hypothetical protein